MAGAEQSDLLRNIVNNSLVEAGLVERDLAEPLVPWMSPAKVNRKLTSGSLTLEDANIFCHVGGPFLGLDPLRVRRFLDQPFHPEFVAEAELALGRCLSCVNDEVQSVTAYIDRAIAASKRLIIYCPVLPTFMLDEPIIDRRVAHLAGHSHNGGDRAFECLRDVAQEQREAFMNYGGFARLAEVVVISTLSGLVQLRRESAPFRRRRNGGERDAQDQTEACFDTIRYDALSESRNIRLVVLNDTVDGPGRRWLWTRPDIGTVALFDSGLLVRRRQRRLACRVLDAKADSLSAYVFANRSRDLEEATALACNGTTKKATISFLDGFLRATSDGGRFRLLMN